MTNTLPIAQQESLLPVRFQEDKLLLIDLDGEPYVPMKFVVTGIGLDWRSQHKKLIHHHRFSRVMVKITIVVEDGKQRSALALPLRKLPGWLMTLSPNKVSPDLREKVIAYQNECDDVLWSHWSQKRTTPKPAPAQAVADPALAATIQALVELDHLKRQQAELVEQQAALIQQNEALEQRQYQTNQQLAELVGGEDYTTVKGYARTHHLPADRKTLQQVGKRASAMCRAQGIPINKVQDEVWDAVNTYPREIIAAAFTEHLP